VYKIPGDLPHVPLALIHRPASLLSLSPKSWTIPWHIIILLNTFGWLFRVRMQKIRVAAESRAHSVHCRFWSGNDVNGPGRVPCAPQRVLTWLLVDMWIGVSCHKGLPAAGREDECCRLILEKAGRKGIRGPNM
jgi:hypothetical protein